MKPCYIHSVKTSLDLRTLWSI